LQELYTQVSGWLGKEKERQMSFNNNNKFNFCRYGCQRPIKFDNNRVSANGLKIPLNLDGSPHDCANRPYNRRKQLSVQTPKSSSKWNVKPCKYGNQPITFDDGVRAASGKRIPLNANGSHHECPKNPYNADNIANTVV
jgi:hypothetical protein